MKLTQEQARNKLIKNHCGVECQWVAEGFGTCEECEIGVATEALEQISHLKGRPCEVCEYHTETGCSKWECVFKGV